MTTQPTHRARAAALTLVSVVALAACGAQDDGESPGTDPQASDKTSQPSSLELTAEPPASGSRCAMPSPELLATSDAAFEGTVTELGDGTASLSVSQWFRGPESEPADVTVTTPSAQIKDLLLAVDFTQGETYLVSATDGKVNVCGLSAASNGELAAMYREAFSS